MKKIAIFFILCNINSNSYASCGPLFQNSAPQEKSLRGNREVQGLLNTLDTRNYNYTKRTFTLLRQSLLNILNNNPSPSIQMEVVEIVKETLSKVDPISATLVLKALLRTNPPHEVQKAIAVVAFSKLIFLI